MAKRDSTAGSNEESALGKARGPKSRYAGGMQDEDSAIVLPAVTAEEPHAASTKPLPALSATRAPLRANRFPARARSSKRPPVVRAPFSVCAETDLYVVGSSIIWHPRLVPIWQHRRDPLSAAAH